MYCIGERRNRSYRRDFEKEMISLGFSEGLQGGNMTVALFDVQQGTGIETRAFIRGIKGFFYRSDSLSEHRLQQRRDRRQVVHQPEHGKDPS
jgi:hypothetical protein